ncbi:MAG: LCP family protein [Oscillospiraceae bacterium]|nr:LCP family protein [Oscillospiraceae bacterium]
MQILKSHAKPRVLSVPKIILLVFLSLLLVFLLAVWLFLNVYTPKISDDITEPPHLGAWAIEGEIMGDIYNVLEGADLEGRIPLDRDKGDGYTFLILGRDNGLLTDTMMLVTFNVADKKVGILNVPRDCYISNSYYSGRINAVLASGYNAALKTGKNPEDAVKDGVDYLRFMIQYTFGIPVDMYVYIDLTGFRDLVDAVGGVEMEVPVDMYYSDPYQDLYIDLKKGWQTLDGKKAEQLVRFRSGYATADIGRIQTQQKFLSALAKKMLKFDVQQISRLFDIAEKHITSNISAADTAWFAAKVLDVKLEDIVMYTVPGEHYMVGKAACYSMYKPEIIGIINKSFNPYKEQIPEENFNIFEGTRTYAHLADTDGLTMADLAGN